MVLVVRAPKIAVPTRTWVAPNAIAMAKSALIPIDSNLSPLRLAIFAVSAKCGAGASFDRRNAHQARHRQAVAVAAGGEKSVGLLRQHAGLLRLGAGIDLDEQQRTAPLPGDLLGERLGEACPVDRVDRVEQRHRLLRLVRLQRADQVQFEAGMPGQQRRPFGLCLLHAVFAEHALAGGDDRLDRLGAERFRYRHQRHALPDRARASRQARTISSRTAASPTGSVHGFHLVNAKFQSMPGCMSSILVDRSKLHFYALSITLRNGAEGAAMPEDQDKSETKSDRPAQRKKPILSIRARLIVLALLAIAPLMFERVHAA